MNVAKPSSCNLDFSKKKKIAIKYFLFKKLCQFLANFQRKKIKRLWLPTLLMGVIDVSPHIILQCFWNLCFPIDVNLNTKEANNCKVQFQFHGDFRPPIELVENWTRKQAKNQPKIVNKPLPTQKIAPIQCTHV